MIKDRVSSLLWLVGWTITISSAYAEDNSASTSPVSKQSDASAKAPTEPTVDAYVKHLSERI